MGIKRPSALNELTNLAKNKIRALFLVMNEGRKNFLMLQLKPGFWLIFMFCRFFSIFVIYIKCYPLCLLTLIGFGGIWLIASCILSERT